MMFTNYILGALKYPAEGNANNIERAAETIRSRGVILIWYRHSAGGLQPLSPTIVFILIDVKQWDDYIMREAALITEQTQVDQSEFIPVTGRESNDHCLLHLELGGVH
jgi:hypothetical protein